MPASRPPDAPFRPNLYVVARFLDALARPEGPPTRSHLQAAVGVNYDVFRRYLGFLEAKGYARAEGDHVRLSAAGRRVRAELLGWIAAFLEGSPLAGGLGPQTLKDDGPSVAPP